MKKYTKVIGSHRDQAKKALEGYNYVTVFEKMDGANASFKLSEDGKSITCFSRRKKLNPEHGLQGFVEWVNENVDKELLLPGIIYFGEWMNPHKVKYKQDIYKKFFLFDLYDVDHELYFTPMNEVGTEIVEKTEGMFLAPVVYQGRAFADVDDYYDLTKKSAFTEDGPAEGVVVKDYHYRDRFNNQVFVKVINEEFKETNNKKVKKEKHLTPEEQKIQTHVDTNISKNGVEKFLLKQVDEGYIGKNFENTKLSTLIPTLKDLFVEDFLSENREEIGYDEISNQLRNFTKKRVIKNFVDYLKQIVNN